MNVVITLIRLQLFWKTITLKHMEPIDLKDFVGEGSDFFLRMPNRSFHLRPFTLGDSLWAERIFGKDVRIENLSVDKLCQLAFQLMEIESQKYFLAKDVEFVNDQGVLITKRLGGPELMFWQISGMVERDAINKALLKSISGTKALEIIEEEEKKSQQFLNATPTGQNSLTSSPSSTDGQQKKSSPAHFKKSASGSKPSQNAGAARSNGKPASTTRS